MIFEINNDIKKFWLKKYKYITITDAGVWKVGIPPNYTIIAKQKSNTEVLYYFEHTIYSEAQMLKIIKLKVFA
jgi:hypothetical protein